MYKIFLFAILVTLSGRSYSADEIIIFVGEKVSLESFEPVLQKNEILMDAAYKAKYKILNLVGGNYENQIIDFEVYDHYGLPQFSKYKHVLLFVTKTNGKYYHIKYQYFPVYPTVDGQWASCGSPYANTHKPKGTDIVAREFTYSNDAVISTDGLTKSEIRKQFPKSFFNHKNGIVTCKKGNSLQELIKVKMQGPLKDLDWYNIRLSFILEK